MQTNTHCTHCSIWTTRLVDNRLVVAATVSGRSRSGWLESSVLWVARANATTCAPASYDWESTHASLALTLVSARKGARADRHSPTTFRDNARGHVTRKRPEVICPLTPAVNGVQTPSNRDRPSSQNVNTTVRWSSDISHGRNKTSQPQARTDGHSEYVTHDSSYDCTAVDWSSTDITVGGTLISSYLMMCELSVQFNFT